MPPLPDTGAYPPEVIRTFTEEQFHEAMNPIPFFPNNYRFAIAHQRLQGASMATRWKYCKDWWGELKKPNYDLFLPPKDDSTPTLTVSFELHVILESDFTLQSGWRFRLRPGALDFIRSLSSMNCELVLYTTFNFNTLQEIASGLYRKTDGLLDLTGGEHYVPSAASEGVSYKLFVNACGYEDGEYIKILSQMNREKPKLLHIDMEPSWVETDWRENCIFFGELLNNDNRLPLLARVIGDVVTLSSEDEGINVPKVLNAIAVERIEA